MRKVVSLLAVAVMSLLLCASARAADAAYEESAAGLKKLNEDILAAVKAKEDAKATALIKGLALNNHAEWFTKTFGEEKGKGMNAVYSKRMENFDADLLKFYQAQLAANKTALTAYKLADAEAKEATGLQRDAMTAMKVKLPLYGLRFVDPGKGGNGMHLWSFVYIDGGFKFVDKLRGQ